MCRDGTLADGHVRLASLYGGQDDHGAVVHESALALTSQNMPLKMNTIIRLCKLLGKI